jgi:hypothetical protein
MSFLDTQSPGLLKPQTAVNNPAGPPASDPNLPKTPLFGQNRENVPHKANLVSQVMGSKVGGAQQTGKPSSSFHAASSGRTDEPSDEENVLLPDGSFMTRHNPLHWKGNGQAQQPFQFNRLNFLS